MNVDHPTDSIAYAHLSGSELLHDSLWSTLQSEALGLDCSLLRTASLDALDLAHDHQITRWHEIASSSSLILSATDQTPINFTDQVQLNGSWVDEKGQSINQERVQTDLLALHPWRKGPIQLGPTFIDTEWRSDWKWDRIASYLPSLQDTTVLDVGCGNGYHC